MKKLSNRVIRYRKERNLPKGWKAKTSLIFLLIFFVMFSSIGYAENYTCVDADTSLLNITGYNSSGILTTIWAENTTCKFGCNAVTGECNPSLYDSSNFMIYLLLPIISFVLLYFTSLLKEEDWIIHLLLLVGALLFLIVPLGLLSNILLSPFSELYMLLTIIVVIVIFYYILKILIGATNVMRGARG